MRDMPPVQSLLEEISQEVAAIWALDLNDGLVPTDVTAVSNRRVWWRCERGQTWQMNVRNRVLRDAGCPYCNDRKVLRGFNDVATVREDLAAQWYQEGNLPLRPTYVTTRSKKRV